MLATHLTFRCKGLPSFLPQKKMITSTARKEKRLPYPIAAHYFFYSIKVLELEE